MKMLIEPLELKTPIAGFNGGVFTQPDLTVISSLPLARAAAAQALDLMREHRLAAWLYTANDWFVPDPKGAHVDRETWTVKFPSKILADFSGHLDQAVKIVGVSDDHEAISTGEKACQKALKGQVSAQLSRLIIST